ncbi:nuclear transport factor 2 family protein [Sphingobium sp. JS3065]|uniref:nuclear transport factor 2 family protein n=1 Tax=Sphingobium sp. JS3065 TaxID=2970925 RepID=UPI0022643252|nr:nuclear transport factor 2 family protein [Sphingobium sp. JS3065]UZW57044.1 nuclear transport factor 2 family protein [Sphingobium sp. JS3065]
MTQAPSFPGSMPRQPRGLTLDDVIAHIEIQQRLVEYCRGVDRGYVEAVSSVYHGDAYDEHGPFKGAASDFANAIVPMLDAIPVNGQHHVTNSLIDVQGDRAKAETYFLSFHPTAEAADGEKPKIMVTGGRYLDTFEKRDGVWRIARRITLMDFAKEGDGSFYSWPGLADFTGSGRREADASHDFFAQV